MIRTILRSIDGDRGHPELEHFLAADCMRKGIPFYKYQIVNGNYKSVEEVFPLLTAALGEAVPVIVAGSVQTSGAVKYKHVWTFGDSVLATYDRSRHPEVYVVGRDLNPFEIAGLQEVSKFLKRERQKPTARVGLMMFDNYNNSLDIQYQPVNNHPFLARNYTPDNVVGFESLVEAVSGECHGRLTIMQGPPGTGKTHFLRALVSRFGFEEEDYDLADQGLDEEVEPEAPVAPPNFIYTPVDMMADLCNPKQLPSLLAQCRGGSKTVLLVEDGNEILQAREVGKPSPVGQFLNAVDGFLGEMMNLHVVVTSNLEETDFDPAVVRPGRLHSKLSFSLLESWQAEQILKEETGQAVPVAAPATLAEIYSIAHEIKEAAKKAAAKKV